MSPFLDMWLIEYHYHDDSFSTRTLGEHLADIQESFHTGVFSGSQILAIHPNETACRDELSLWLDRRDANPNPPELRAESLLRFVPPSLAAKLQHAPHDGPLLHALLNR